MIEERTFRCDNCGKKLAVKLIGYLEIVCTRCKHFNIFDTEKKGYTSHKVISLNA